MNDFTKGNEKKLILLFTLPMLASNILQQVYNIVDSMVVGLSIGKVALGATTTVSPIIFFILSLTLGITTGTTIVVAQYYGAKDEKNIGEAVHTSFLFLMLLSIVIAVLGWIFSDGILSILNVPENVMEQSRIYLKITFLGVPMVIGYNIITSILRAVGDSKRPLYFLLFSSILNIILDILFVVVFKWGVAGSAYGTLISETISFLISLFYMNKKIPLLKISIGKLKINRSILGAILKIGIPSGIQYVFVSLGSMFLQSLLNGFGTDTMTAYGIGARIDNIGTMSATTFSSALSAFVAQNIGAGREDRVKNGFKSTVVLGTLITLIIVLTIQVFNKSIVGAFNKDGQVIILGSEYLRISSIFYILPVIQFSIYGLFRGAGNSVVPMIISIASLWIMKIPSAYILSQPCGSACIYMSNAIAWVGAAILALVYYIKGNWKKNKALIEKVQ